MPTNIDRDDVQRLMQEGAQLVEVLPPAEYEEIHLPGAINIKDWDTEASRSLKGNWFGITLQAVTAAVVAAGGIAVAAISGVHESMDDYIP